MSIDHLSSPRIFSIQGQGLVEAVFHKKPNQLDQSWIEKNQPTKLPLAPTGLLFHSSVETVGYIFIIPEDTAAGHYARIVTAIPNREGEVITTNLYVNRQTSPKIILGRNPNPHGEVIDGLYYITCGPNCTGLSKRSLSVDFHSDNLVVCPLGKNSYLPMSPSETANTWIALQGV